MLPKVMCVGNSTGGLLDNLCRAHTLNPFIFNVSIRHKSSDFIINLPSLYAINYHFFVSGRRKVVVELASIECYRVVFDSLYAGNINIARGAKRLGCREADRQGRDDRAKSKSLRHN